MNKDPAFLFYSSDFLTGTFTMTDEQVGKYIRLLCLQHQKGHLQENHMVMVCKTYDETIYSKFIQDDKGNYYNERLEGEMEKRAKYTESRRLNGIQGGRPPKPYDNHMDNVCKPCENHIENDNVNVNIDTNGGKKKINYSAAFEIFYSTYPNPFNKEQTFKNWNTTLKSDTAENIMIALKKYKEFLTKKPPSDKHYITRSTNFIGQQQDYKGYLPEKKEVITQKKPIFEEIEMWGSPNER